MTRIISGFAGSRELKVPKSGTRPTSDRVREAIFSSLESQEVIADARVLDLYAGSGALGLEALSRGAHSVTLVEKNPQAVSILKHNAELIRQAGKLNTSSTVIMAVGVEAFLAQPVREKFDVVFIDPPYDLSNDELIDVLTGVTAHLSTQALVVLERSSRSPVPSLPEGLRLERTKSYGETTIYWLEIDG